MGSVDTSFLKLLLVVRIAITSLSRVDQDLDVIFNTGNLTFSTPTIRLLKKPDVDIIC